MSDFRFDLQRFDSETVTISAGETFTADGITYTAGTDGAVLTTTDDKVTGISSGSVVAKLTDNDSSPAITFDGATAFDFACSAGTSILDVPYIRVERTGATINYTGGKVNHSAEGISGAGEVSVTGTMANVLPFTVTFDIPDAGMDITLDGNTNVSAPEAVNASLTFPESITTLLENLKPLLPVLLNVDEATADKLYDVAVKLISNPITVELQGEHSWNQDEKRLTITDGSYLVMNLLDYSLNLAAQDGDIDGLNFFYQRTDDALNAGAKFTPSTDEKAQLQLNFTKDGTQIFNGLLNVAAGAVNLDVVNASASVEKDTTLTITQSNFSAEFTYNDAATVTYSADKDGLSNFTFGDGDGSVDITLKTALGSISANVEINGTLTLDTTNQTFGVTSGTTTTITLDENRYISLTATDDAGFTISQDTDGKFILTPGKDDGSLDITIKRGDSTFSGNLEINGALTFDLATQALGVTSGTTTTITIGSTSISITATDDAGFTISQDADGKITIKHVEGDGSLDFTITRGDTSFSGNLEINGAFTFDPTTQALGVTGGTTTTLTIGSTSISITATDDAGFTISQDADGKLIIAPAEGDGSLDFTIKRGDSTFSGNLEINGAFTFDPTTQAIGVTGGTTTTITIGSTSISITATDDAGFTISQDTDGKLIIAPAEGDGSLDFTIKRGDSTFSGNLEVNGALTFDLATQALGVTSGTTTTLTIGSTSISITATDDAGFTISQDTDGKIKITPAEGDGSLDFTIKRGDSTFSGNLEINGAFTFDPTTQAIGVTGGTTTTLTIGSTSISITATDDAGFTISQSDGKIILTPDNGDGSLDITVKYGDKTVFQNTVGISGAFTFDPTTQALGVTSGTTTTITIGSTSISITATDDAGFTISQSDGKIILTPADGDGSLDFTITRGDGSTTKGNLEVSGGAIILDGANQKIGLRDGTVIGINFSGYKVTLTAVGDAASALTLTEAGITLTPVEGDGTLDILLGSAGGEMSANLEILSGSLALGGGNIFVEEDTELQITFSDEYSVKFKATGDAGGKISLGADGITFTPNSGDGGLELSVTQGGETRTASLDVTGSVTYRLDGSISLAAGTVVKNKFADGNILTITANTDAGGSIIFAPDDGLTITPTTPDALTATLTTGDVEVVKVTSIDGSINYKGGVLTASDGTTAHIFYYFGWESELRTSGGTSSVQFTTDRTVYIANEGATFVIDYLDGTTAEIQNGIYSDIYATETSDAIELISEGSTFKSNDNEVTFTLEKAGNYNLNGMNITTTEDGVQVTLSDYDTATFEADAPVKISTGDGGKFFRVIPNEETVSFTTKNLDNTAVTGGTVEFDNATKTLSTTAGTALTVIRDAKVVTLTASQDVSMSYKVEEDIYYFMLDGEVAGEILVTRGGIPTFAGKVTAGGVLSFNPAAGTCGLTGATSSHGDGTNSYVNFTLADGSAICAQTDNDTLVFIPTFIDGTLEVNFPNERKHAMKFTVAKDGYTLFENHVAIDGTLGWNTTTKEFYMTKGTSAQITFGEYVQTVTAPDDTAIKIGVADGKLTLTADKDGSLDLTFTRGQETLSGNVAFSAGSSIALDPANQTLSMAGGTTTTITLGENVITLSATDDATVKIAITDGKIELTPTHGDGSIDFTLTRGDTTLSGNLEVSGSLTFDPANQELTLAGGTTTQITLGENVITLTTTDDAGITLAPNTDGTFTLTAGTGDGSLDLNITAGDATLFDGQISLDGSIILDLAARAFHLTADTRVTFNFNNQRFVTLTATDTHSFTLGDGQLILTPSAGSLLVNIVENGQTTFDGSVDLISGSALLATDSLSLTGGTTAQITLGENVITLTTTDDLTLNHLETAQFTLTATDAALNLNITRGDEKLFDGNLSLDGSVGMNLKTKQFTLAGGSVLKLKTDGETALEITATDDAGGNLTFSDGALRFAPNSGDGSLQLNFALQDRKVTLNVEGAVLLSHGSLSLEKDSAVNLQWQDGSSLTLTATDTGGQISADDQGLKVSSAGELNIDLTTASGVQTTLTHLNGSLHYNAGKVLFDPDSTLTATSSLGGQPTLLTVTAAGSGAYVEISALGTRYVAGSGALSVTWSRDDKQSSFAINTGSVFIGHGIFQIAEGSDISTDLQDLIPALYFTTTDPGNYTINNQTITTTAQDISMTATDDYMTFVTSDDPVLFNDMSFAGAGNVSLSSSAGVVLGALVEATGFGVDKSFVLAEAGNVTADSRIFELTEDVPTGISVTGAEDGFIFSRVNTEESEARFDDPDPANVGKIFTEEFFLTNDDAYRIQTDLLGLQKIIGVTAPSTLNATATFDGEPERTVFDAVTDNEGVFTIGDKNYSISGDDHVAIKTIFNESLAAVRGFESLSGTVAGDFTAHEVSINGSASAFQVYNDSLISISADEDGYEIKGLDPEDFLAPVATDTYIVNSTSINANAGDLIFGRSDGAQLFALNNDTIINGTESDDIIDNIGSNVSIYGHAGNDSLGNMGSGNVDGGAGDDTIDNYADDVTISGGAGDDSIVSEGDNVYLSGGDGDDTIYNHGDDIIIDGGAGDDSISNNSANVTFIHSGGDDTIEGFNETSALQIEGDYSTAKSGSDVIVTVGEEEIRLVGAASLASVQIIGREGSVIANIDNNRVITGTGGNDSILNIGDNVTIGAYGGDDTIDNYGEGAVIEGSEGADSISNNSAENTLTANGVSINAGAGNDTIRNVHAYYVTLEGGAGDDYISVSQGNQTKIEGGAGNDTIVGEAESDWAMGGYATINGGADDDYINPVFSDSASILGGRGNDTIINEGDDATINGGAGDDVISLVGASLNNDVIKYEAWNGGNDSVFGFNETTQLSITAGTKYETAVSGEDVLVTVGEYVLTLAGAASLSTVNIVNYKVSALNISNTTDGAQIRGTELADTIGNSGAQVTVSGRSGNDSITSSGELGSLNGGAGNDTLENAGAGATVEGYYGDDYLTNSGAGVLVNGNYGNDTVINSGDNATLNPGSGNNSIVNTGANVLINFTGGADSVWGFNETTSLQTASGATSLRSGGDIVVTVGEDKITLVDAASVVSPNFEDGESIVLTKKGEQFIDGERVFELIQNVPTGVTLTGAQNGFTSAILTDDGELFVEEFTVEYDDSYNVSINGGGVQTVSGISAGAEVTSNATSDGQETENQIYVVTDGAGSFLLNDMAITASDAATIRLRPQAMAFAAEGMTYDGKTFAGSGNVTVGADLVALGASVSAAGFEVGDEFILAQAGTATVDGRVFELTENISEGATISVERDGYTFSHTITQKEATKNNLPSDYVGKLYSENIVVENDDNYSVRADSFGLKKISGISDGATINGGDTSVDGNSDDKYAQGGQYLYIDTDSEGAFTFGEKTYSISGDSNVELEADFNQSYAHVRGVQDLDGTISGNFDGDGFKVNGKKTILIAGDESISVVGTESGTKIYGVSDGASVVYAGGVKEIHTDTEGTFTFGEDDNTVAVTVQGDDNINFKLNALQYIEDIADVQGDLIFSYTSDKLLVNGIGGTFDGGFSSIGAYDDIYIHDVTDGSKFTTADADKIWLQMTGEHFTLNNNALTLTNDADGIWIRDKEIVGLDANASLKVTAAGNYIVNETELKAKSGSVIIGESDGAYIYDTRYPYLTKDTTRDELIEVFKPENTYTPSDSASLTLESGDLAIVDAAKVNIASGDGATVVNRGEDVNVSLTGGNTWLFAQGGSMNLTGYDHTTGTGFGTNRQNILSAVADGKIDFNRGRLTLDDAEVFFPENSALMNFFNLYGKQYKVGFASQGEALDVSNVADDLILVAKRNATVTSGAGDDSILANAGSFVDAGTGKNLVISDGANVSLSGRTTVTGTVDTIHAASPPAVDFTKDGLAFYHGTNSLLLADTLTTTRISMFYEEVDGLQNQLREAVYIADDEWYKVADGAVEYYVGATANKTHGLDFSGVSEPLNVTLNTDYLSTTAECWINNVHSIKGGDGLTTITGSELDDTILAGTGATTINAGKGFDKLYGNTGANKNPATFVYAAGDGQDSIANFDFMSDRSDVTADKVKFDEASGVTDVMLRGDDVMIKVNDADGFLMLEDARGQSFRLNDDLIAKVDTDVAFDGFTNCYVGIGERATLTVGKGMGDVEVWLSDDKLEYHGTMYDGNFKVIDASQSDGANILAGNELRNTIIGGAGDNSLWGGYGGENDLLIAGAGHNEYYYEVGNGHDTIAGANEGDVIHLGATLEQIDFDGTNMSADGITVKFTDGGQLDITGSSSVSFSFDDGTTVKANRQTQQFE